jgi:biotin carboxyl carrier protein
MKFDYQSGDEVFSVQVEKEDEIFRITIGDRTYEVAAVMRPDGRLLLDVDGAKQVAILAGDARRRHVAVDGGAWILERPQPQRRRSVQGAEGGGSLTATMPGLVLDVLVAEGEEVQRGDTLVLLEAMKMELRITAPFAGRVGRVHCAAGQVVDRGQLLVEVQAGPGSAN